MTEIEVYEQSATPAVVAPVSGNELEVMIRQADLLSQSDIIPSAYRRKPQNVLVAAMTGRTFGWDVMTAMRNGHVIEGTFTIKPEAMLALVRRAGHSVNGSTSPTGAKVTGKRGDTGDEMSVEFTLDDAVRAGLCTIKDGKSYARSSSGKKLPWEQYPQAMCWARAVSQLCRMLFADVTLGLSYTPEELGAEVDADGEVVSAAPAIPAASNGPKTISQLNIDRLKERCGGMGISVVEVVRVATEGRTDDPANVLITEVQALRDACEAVAAAKDDYDRAGAESDAEEAVQVYAPDDPERPFTGDEPPYPDPDTGEAF